MAATKLKPVDVVAVGVGLTGTILAKELADAGLRVVGLERGPMRDTQADFALRPPDLAEVHEGRGVPLIAEEWEAQLERSLQ